MASNRFVIAFLCCFPTLVMAAPPTVQEVSQLFHQGKQTQALDKIDAFLAANPKDAQGRFLKGLILTELNRVPEAIKVFSDLTDDYPELPEPYNNLAVLYAAQGQYERAKNSLEMAIRTHPSYATAHENLGDIYAKMASMAYDKALQLDQANTSAKTKLALIKELFGPLPPTLPTKSKTTGKPSQARTSGMTETPAPDKAEPAPTEKAETAPAKQETTVKAGVDAKSAVEHAVNAWAKAWSSQDVAAYLDAYAADYAQQGMDHAAWEAQRRERLTKPAWIKVSLTRLKIEIDGNKATATFHQNYRSNHFHDWENKTLMLELRDGVWKITSES